MTIIQPHYKEHSHAWVFALAGLVVGLIGASVMVVVLYNQSVDLSHRVAKAKSDLKAFQTENAELTDRMFSRLSSGALDALAAEHALVKDKNPTYLDLGKSWELASQ